MSWSENPFARNSPRSHSIIFGTSPRPATVWKDTAVASRAFIRALQSVWSAPIASEGAVARIAMNERTRRVTRGID